MSVKSVPLGGASAFQPRSLVAVCPTESAASCNKCLLFGGKSQRDVYGDMWEIELSSSNAAKAVLLDAGSADCSAASKSPSEDHPGNRFGAAMTLVEDLDSVVLIGGTRANGTRSNEVFCWSLSAKTWSRVVCEGPDLGQRTGHTACTLASPGSAARIAVYGGDDVTSENKALAIVTLTKDASGKLSGVTSYPQQGGDGAPEPRKDHASAVSENGKRMFLFGGFGNVCTSNLDDVWVLEVPSGDTGYSWTKGARKGAVPDARTGLSAAVFDDKFCVWGGWGASKNRYDEIHYMDTGDFTWNKKTPMMKPPAERYYHRGAVFSGKRLLMLGGQLPMNSSNFADDAVVLDASRIY